MNESIKVKVETFIRPSMIEQVTSIGENVQRTVFDVRELHIQKALNTLGWYQVKNPQMTDDPIVKGKLETKLYKWFDKRFSGRYFNFKLKERDEYLQSCAKELSKAIKDAVRERFGKEDINEKRNDWSN